MTVAAALPAPLEAHKPPEARGLARDEVRLMVTYPDGSLAHARALELPRFLRPGDLVVVNTSRTIPARLEGTRADGTRLDLHLSTPVRGGGDPPLWLVELRENGSRFCCPQEGEILALPAGGSARLLARDVMSDRLWITELDLPGDVLEYLERHGSPIRYAHTRGDWPLDAYQNVFATEPGSAEMPSAGRPLTERVLQALGARGIRVAPLLLHTGVASLERGERPYPERFRVPEQTAGLVGATRRQGGRVIAVGTSVVRALETAGRPDGSVRTAEGWTDLIVTPARGLRVVDGLMTGWHHADSTHLLMLEAIAGPERVERSYAVALAAGYLWHEFGDSNLILR